LWIYALIAFAIHSLWGEPVNELLKALFRSIVLSPIGPYIDGVIWTLVVEAVFYSAITVVILIASRNLEFDVFTAFASLLGSMSALFLLTVFLITNPQVFSILPELVALLERYFFSVLLLRHGVFFAIGMLLWKCERDGYTFFRSTCIAIFLLAGIYQIMHQAGAHNPFIPVLIWLVALVVFLVSLRTWNDVKDPFWATTFRNLGDLSYPIYLGHFTVGMYLTPFVATYIKSELLLLVALLTIIIGLACAVLFGPERWLQRTAKSAFLPPRARHA
jgi:peptidoglycan/LPS O-acetylase OafA/YrhL